MKLLGLTITIFSNLIVVLPQTGQHQLLVSCRCRVDCIVLSLELLIKISPHTHGDMGCVWAIVSVRIYCAKYICMQ